MNPQTQALTEMSPAGTDTFNLNMSEGVEGSYAPLQDAHHLQEAHRLFSSRQQQQPISDTEDYENQNHNNLISASQMTGDQPSPIGRLDQSAFTNN
jgi:hypothetical protein